MALARKEGESGNHQHSIYSSPERVRINSSGSSPSRSWHGDASKSEVWTFSRNEFRFNILQDVISSLNVGFTFIDFNYILVHNGRYFCKQSLPNFDHFIIYE